MDNKLIFPEQINIENLVKKFFQESVQEGLNTIFSKEYSLEYFETKDLLTFEQFCVSKDHMDIVLSDRQLKAAKVMLGDDIYKIFDNKKELAILVWGKGSGKDLISILILCYVVYLLLNMKSPQKYFKMPESEWLDCVNTAPSAQNAATVFFEKLRQKILRWKWLFSKYAVKHSGAFISQIKPDPGQQHVVITKDGIIFPKLIRLLSRNSSNESAEGLNTLVYILDEASAFVDNSNNRNADKVFKSLRSSSVSRFGNRGKGFIISYPRESNDFTLRMYKKYKDKPYVYSDQAAVWDVKPVHLFSKEFFTFEGYKIPIEFKHDFEADPTDAKKVYMAIPPEVECGFFEFPEKVDKCTSKATPPMVVFEDFIYKEKVCKRIVNFANIIPSYSYIITLDLGETSDTAALSLFHSEYDSERKVQIFKQDLVTGWSPDRKNKYTVSFVNVFEIIKMLSLRIPITGCWFDYWQSVTLVEQLKTAGIFADTYVLKYLDYRNLKEYIYTDRVVLQPFDKQIEELKKLIDFGTRIDHPSTGSKDYADTICGAIKIFIEKYPSIVNQESESLEGSEFGEPDNLGREDPFL